MDLIDHLDVVNILNIDLKKSTIQPLQLISNPNHNDFIVSYIDGELRLIIGFKKTTQHSPLVILIYLYQEEYPFVLLIHD